MIPQPLSLIIINATLWTPDAVPPPGADGVGIAGDRLAYVGSSANLLRLGHPTTQVIDARGGLLVPGFTDSHCHFLDGGLRLLSVRLRSAATPQEFIARIHAAAAGLPRGSWLRGGDWDHQAWGGILPEKSWIDPLTPEHPLWLNRLDGHMALANSLALKIAGITASTPDPEGGVIVRDARGEPTGILKDSAQNLVMAHLPPRSAEENDRALAAAMDYMATRGVTAVHSMVTVDCVCGLWPRNGGLGAEQENMDAAYHELSVYRRAQQAGTLRTRIHTCLPLASWRRLHEEIQRHGNGDAWLRIGGLKAMVDGSLGTHTAAMLDDYDDRPGDRGMLIWRPELLEALVYDASEAGLQVMVHAIGDRGVRTVLDIFARVRERTGNPDLRLRVEHAQHIAPTDIPRFAELGVIASMQLTHLADDGRWAPRVIGAQRMASSWPIKSLLQSGATVALGSDWFVTEPSPLEGIYAAVTRCTIDGAHPDGLIPSERVTVEQALTAYTLAPAYAIFEEQQRGSIKVGKLADLVLLDRDIRALPPEEILPTRVLLTVVGGKPFGPLSPSMLWTGP